jgi:hypothetical protein
VRQRSAHHPPPDTARQRSAAIVTTSHADWRHALSAVLDAVTAQNHSAVAIYPWPTLAMTIGWGLKRWRSHWCSTHRLRRSKRSSSSAQRMISCDIATVDGKVDNIDRNPYVSLAYMSDPGKPA